MRGPQAQPHPGVSRSQRAGAKAVAQEKADRKRRKGTMEEGSEGGTARVRRGSGLGGFRRDVTGRRCNKYRQEVGDGSTAGSKERWQTPQSQAQKNRSARGVGRRGCDQDSCEAAALLQDERQAHESREPPPGINRGVQPQQPASIAFRRSPTAFNGKHSTATSRRRKYRTPSASRRAGETRAARPDRAAERRKRPGGPQRVTQRAQGIGLERPARQSSDGGRPGIRAGRGDSAAEAEA